MTRDNATREPKALLQVRYLFTYFRVRRGGLGRSTGVCRAVDGVSFQIDAGTTLGLVGESGCGKTTLGRTILRLISPTEGRVWFDGTDVFATSGGHLGQLRRDMQIVFQDPFGSLNPRMTIGEIVAEPLAIQRVGSRSSRRQRVADLLERVGLNLAHAERYPHEFSGGQRQRIGIARALAPQPKFVVCDEPVSALDVSVQSQILNLLGDLQAELGLTFLFIAHNLAVVKQISDRVAVMYLGRIVELAAAADLYRGPAHPYTMALLEAAPEPDPTRPLAERSLLGEPGNPIDPPTGCSFHPRCRWATEECRRLAPRLKSTPELAPGHLVACHHVGQVTPGAESGHSQ